MRHPSPSKGVFVARVAEVAGAQVVNDDNAVRASLTNRVVEGGGIAGTTGGAT